MLGAAYIFTIGSREHMGEVGRHVQGMEKRAGVPLRELVELLFICAILHSMGGSRGRRHTPLDEFEHPERAIYLLGAEDAGLPASVVRACHCCVSLDAVRACGYNVSVAGSIVLYDRLRKLGQLKGRAPKASTGTSAQPK